MIYISWNAPADFINKAMFRPLCSVNALSRVSFMSCSRYGKTGHSK